MSNASNSQGVKLQRGGLASTDPFVTLSEVKDWTGPKKSSKDIDCTSLDSGAKESRPGLVDYGECSVNGLFVADDAQHTGMNDDLDDRVVRYWKLQLADTDATHLAASSWVFLGYVKSFDVKGGVDKVVEFSAAIKITGKPTFTPRS